MGQEHKEYTWNLIAKKLMGMATPEEMRELELLLRNNPELHYPMQTIMDLWKSYNPDDKREAIQAFNKHLDRMQQLNIDFSTIPQKSSAANRLSILGPQAQADPANQRDPIDNVSEPYPISPITPKKNNKRKAILLAAACSLAFLIALFALYPNPAGPVLVSDATAYPVKNSKVFTRNGSRTQMVLPDGTKVWLNAGSCITFGKEYGGLQREVSLSGEAFFDVVHNAEKPFVIHTSNIDIKVLGTRFNVKSYPSEKTTEATLIKGSIEVSIKARPSEKIILKPNEKLVIANDDSVLNRVLTYSSHHFRTAESLVTISKPTYEQNTGAIIETSWVENKLIFQDEAFSELAVQMDRWYGVNIRFDNPKLEEWRFTGTFEKETIKQALDALKLTANFTYSIQDNQIRINDK